MTKFQYTYNSADIEVVHLSVDDVFDITLIRREAGIEIDVLEYEGDTSLGGAFVANPYRGE